MTAGEGAEKRRNRRRALWVLNGLVLVLVLAIDWARHRPAPPPAAPQPPTDLLGSHIQAEIEPRPADMQPLSSALLPKPPPGSVPLERAPKVAPGVAWRSENTGDHGLYFWRSDREIIRFTGDGHGNYRAFRLDTRTGKEAPFRLDGKPFVLYDAWDLTVSPDGKWLLWWKGDGPRIVGRALDGSGGRRSWRLPPGVRFISLLGDAWLPGGDAWVRLAGVRDEVVAIIYRLRPGKDTAEVAPLPRLEALSTYQSIGTAPHLLGFSRTGQSVILWGDQVSPEHGPRVGTFTVADSVRISRGFTVPRPPGMNSGEVEVSPRGNRLLWHTFTELPELGRTRFALFVSDLNGRGMREIGHTFLPPADDWGYSRFALRWTPDGKRISFIHEGVLRVLPVD